MIKPHFQPIYFNLNNENKVSNKKRKHGYLVLMRD